ncbi:hypothetical protein HanIR_Chr01g0013081 [Helianthus annuus]|nr:hypothetical protein HanIR_Chr01g0013081 [Helianthus annuus]
MLKLLNCFGQSLPIVMVNLMEQILYQLQKNLNELTQGNDDIATYFAKLKCLVTSRYFHVLPVGPVGPVGSIVT